MLPERLLNGKLPRYAWPGGYPLYYLSKDGDIVCADCANDCANDPDRKLVAYGAHFEGPPLICEHCGAAIQSAYGEVEEVE